MRYFFISASFLAVSFLTGNLSYGNKFCRSLLSEVNAALGRMECLSTSAQNRAVTRFADEHFRRNYQGHVENLLKKPEDDFDGGDIEYLQRVLRHFDELQTLNDGNYYRESRFLSLRKIKIRKKLEDVAQHKRSLVEVDKLLSTKQSRKFYKSLKDSELKMRIEGRIRAAILKLSTLENLTFPKNVKKDKFVHRGTHYRILFTKNEGGEKPNVIFIGTHESYNVWLRENRAKFIE